MRSRARVLGHPIHPMLVVFPLALFTTAFVFDVVHFFTGNSTFSQIGFWNITAGAIGAILAGLAGLADFRAIPTGSRAKSIGRRHALLNVVVLVLFVVSWIIRLDRPGHVAGGGLVILELAAILIAAVAAWHGGELVDRLGIGVDEEANPDAPSSLAKRRRRIPRAAA